MIAAAFPPTGGPGVQRSAKFARYLPQFGWQPTVWTLDPLDGLPMDQSLRDELPEDVKVHSKPAPRRVLRALRRRMTQVGSSGCAVPTGFLSRLADVCSWRLTAFLHGRSFPDEFASWASKSVRPLEREIKDQSIDLIYSTFSPASNHQLAMELKARTGLPWVADFRDLWTDDYRYAEPREAVHEQNVALQRRILAEADVIVGVTVRQTELLARHGLNPLTKFTTITNGFDPDDFAGPPLSRPDRRERFVVAHVGRFDKWRVTDALIDGLKRFVSDHSASRERFILRIVGHADPATLQRVAAAGVAYEFVEHVEHRQAVREMMSADALLLALPDGPNAASVIAAKLFEYLASRRPIVVVGPRHGECERIVKRCRAGVIADFNGETIAAALRRVFKRWEEGRPLYGCAPADAEAYSRVALTRQLVSLFDFLVEGGNGKPLESARRREDAVGAAEPVKPKREATSVPSGASAAKALLIPCRCKANANDSVRG
jgi:glycosyltransferase involved in cell wall biosynthesis